MDSLNTDQLESPVALSSKAARRTRGEIACRECRKLKVKCNRMIPCSTCIKRGCASLCPNGTIPPGQGSRFVLAATGHLQDTLFKLESRMHRLEDALAIAQATTSETPHPLLLSAEEEQEDEEAEPTLKAKTEPTDVTSDTLGTLYIQKNGTSRFFGGGAESLLLNFKGIDQRKLIQPPLPELDHSYLPAEIDQICRSFPFTPLHIPTKSVQSSIESFLPPISRAIYLCDVFLEHLSWMFHIISRQHIVDQLIPAIYQKGSYGPHDLALMLVVLAIGALVDLNLDPYNLEAQHYYRLVQAAVGLQPVLAQQSVVTIKVLHLMSIYNGMSGKESNLEQSYALLNLAGQVALRIGFHIDPSLWGFSGKEAYDRRVYFWNLLQGSLWQSLVTGRPPIILSAFIDCKIPTPEEEQTFQHGEVPLGFGIWGFKATKQCLVRVVRVNLAPKPPPYSQVLELDSEIRAFVTPTLDSAPFNERTAVSMQTFVRSHYQDLMLLFLHRAFFAQAMVENPVDPLAGPHGPSVTAAYQSACVVLDDTRVQFMKKPLLCARVFRIWTFAFAAAVIVGTVAIKGGLGLNPPPLEQFEFAYSLFQRAAQTSSRAADALPVLETMLQRAIEMDRSRRQRAESSQENDISIFGGRATLIQPTGHAPFINLDEDNEGLAFQSLLSELQAPEGTSMAERWSSFIKNYNIMEDR